MLIVQKGTFNVLIAQLIEFQTQIWAKFQNRFVGTLKHWNIRGNTHTHTHTHTHTDRQTDTHTQAYTYTHTYAHTHTHTHTHTHKTHTYDFPYLGLSFYYINFLAWENWTDYFVDGHNNMGL